MRPIGSDRPVSVLFVCFENAAMSLLAESILRSLRSRRFTVASATLEPTAAVNPLVELEPRCAEQAAPDPRYARDAMRDAFWILMRRIQIFVSLPHHAVPRHSIRYRVEGIATWA